MENISWIQFRNITKRFPGVIALNDVSFDVKQGEILALCGENGAGKSTLINFCSGQLKPEKGEILLNGKAVHFKNPEESEREGIAVVHQEVPMCLNMTVAENMFLGPHPVTKGLLLNSKYMNEHARNLLDIFGLTCRADDRIGRLSIAEQSLVQILKAIDKKPKFLILDEPTSSLGDEQKDILFKLLLKMRTEENVTIMYVSHRLEEIMKIADRVVVLRDGRFVNTVMKENTSIEDIIRMMVGRDVGYASVYKQRQIGDTVIKVSNLTTNMVFNDVAFEVKRGEILGFAGFQGAGRSEVSRAVFGLDKCDSIDLEIEGEKVQIKSSEDAIKHGIALISENRRDDGVIPNFDVQGNTVITALRKVLNGMLFINNNACIVETQKYVDMMSIKISSQNQLMVTLSGGNQQKVIIGRWLMSQPKVLFCDEPNRGIDVGAKAEIHSILMDLAEQGMSIIVISNDLQELMAVCDRAVIMCEGRVTGELHRDEFSEEKFVALASKFSI